MREVVICIEKYGASAKLIQIVTSSVELSVEQIEGLPVSRILQRLMLQKEVKIIRPSAQL